MCIGYQDIFETSRHGFVGDIEAVRLSDDSVVFNIHLAKQDAAAPDYDSALAFAIGLEKLCDKTGVEFSNPNLPC